MHRIDSGFFIEDPLTIHGNSNILVRSKNNPEITLDKFKTDIVFTFVRHPLRRAYSCFNEKIFFKTKYSFPLVRKFIQSRYNFLFTDNPTVEEHRRNFLCFLCFALETVENKNGWRKDAHWISQSLVLRKTNSLRRLDFIGRVEKFEAHLQIVFALADLKKDFCIPRMNEGPPPPFPYDLVVDEEIKDVARHLYGMDINNFGYVI